MPKVLVLLSTYNGEKYLEEQLASLFSQSYKDFKLIVRDDGSTDGTKEILNSYNMELIDSSENIGVKKSFETLLKYASENSDAEYFMFCDQDDIWKSSKIEKTLEKMKELENLHGKNMPLLVHTDLEVVDEDLKTIHHSMWQYEKINPKLNTLNRLLVHNTITGCTTMINSELLKKSLPITKECIMHDWWIGLVATCFGKIAYINDSTIKYRQHIRNDTGSKKFDLKYIFKKINFKDTDKYILQAKNFLEAYEQDLDEEKRQLLKDFSTIKEKPYLQRVNIILKYRLFKYGIIRNIGLLIKI